MKIECPISRNARENAAAVALRDHNHRITYSELETKIVRYAKKMKSLHLSKGDRIVIIADNSIEYIILIFALQRIGISFVPIHLRWTPYAWKQAINQAHCSVLVVDTKYHNDLIPTDLPVFFLDSDSEKSIQSLPDSNVQIPATLNLETESSVIFTSGSSGTPKGVKLSIGNHYYNALGSNQNIVLTTEDCWLGSLPFYHVGGLSILHRCFLAGAAVFITPNFTQQKIMDLLQERMITHLSLVPTMLESLMDLDHQGNLLKRVKVILLGGAPASKTLVNKIKKTGLPVVTTYGMTETASQVTTLSPQDPKNQLKTAGRSLPHREIGIMNKNGKIAQNGEGEIFVRGKVLFKGYLHSNKIYRNNTWFPTGDVGTIDDNGFLTVAGRIDEMIISGGENISPKRIEESVRTFPGISDCAVIGVDDQKWGQRPILFISVENISTFPLENLKHYLADHLSKIEIPDQIILLDRLPRLSIGKIDKKRLRDDYLRGIY